MTRIEKSGELKGRSMEAKVATIIFTAARATGKARTYAQIWKYTDTTKKEVSTCYKKIKSLFPEETEKARLQPADIVETACNKLKLPADVTKAAKITAVNIQRRNLCEGRKPQTIAGVSMYMIISQSKCEVPIEEIADKVDIKPTTINECYSKIWDRRQHILPEYWKN